MSVTCADVSVPVCVTYPNTDVEDSSLSTTSHVKVLKSIHDNNSIMPGHVDEVDFTLAKTPLCDPEVKECASDYTDVHNK